jgi:hypothetical protein
MNAAAKRTGPLLGLLVRLWLAQRLHRIARLLVWLVKTLRL